MVATAYESGELIGKFLPVFLVLLLLVKIIPLLKQKDYNTLSVLALTIILSGWLMMAVIAGLQHWTQFPQTMIVISSFLFVLAALGALVLGVIGLTELAEKRNPPIKGRKHAIWAIVLSVLLVTIGTFAFVQRIKSGPDFLSKNRTEPKTSIPIHPEIKKYQNLNFQFELPNKPWVSLDAKKVNKDATLAFIRNQPQMVFMVIAEDIGKNLNLDTPALVEIAKANLKSVAENYSFLKEENKKVRGMDGTIIVTEATLSKKNFIYAHWIYSDGRYGYQLILFADHSEVESTELLQNLNQMLAGFKQINSEPNQSATEQEGGGKRIYQSTRYGYSVSETDESWQPWPEVSFEKEGSDFGFQQKYGEVYIYSVLFYGTPPDLDTLAHGLMKAAGEPYPDETVSKILLHDPSGYEFSETPKPSLGYHVNYRLIKRESSGYFIVSRYMDTSKKTGPEVIKRALSYIHFDSDPVVPSPSELSYKEKKFFEKVYQEMGFRHYNQKNNTQSIEYLKFAFELQKSEPQLLSNIIDVFIATGQYKEAESYLNQYSNLFQGDSKLQMHRVVLNRKLGKQR